ncbi:hypothetical protein JIN84_12120 [Luteolibacter yonseiensis]|uniref:CHAT domain-containing protein n=2 Tax=Luteolibacter yonseiensis TaxID=1144680 RepID=A0A934R0Y1_9BACT|nr:CHAT domain-containing protein [Luteolibacter yonseiensis]MBK1816363.1 hypothetical protein [Luteolibacter yonseiensis]
MHPLSSGEIREHLSQARTPKANSINVSDCLGKSGHFVDFSTTKNSRTWSLTASGIKEMESRLISRIGSIPHLGGAPKKSSTKSIDMLFLGLGPLNEDRLRLDEETREIENKIRTSEFRANLNFKSKWAVRPADLFQYLNEINPQIVHLSGHGAPNGGIAFEDAAGNSKLVSPKALADAFETMKDNIRIIFLNSCYSDMAAKEISKAIDCVVGISGEIDDSSAIAFSASFYSAIGFGHSVQRAFREARSTLVMEGLPGDHLLQLFSRPSVDSDNVVLL